jgi:hypothetical protein
MVSYDRVEQMGDNERGLSTPRSPPPLPLTLELCAVAYWSRLLDRLVSLISSTITLRFPFILKTCVILSVCKLSLVF